MKKSVRSVPGVNPGTAWSGGDVAQVPYHESREKGGMVTSLYLNIEALT
jgi:hypothetical protein